LKELLGGPEAHARAETWLCAQLLGQKQPKAVLERIGPEAQPWEKELPTSLRAPLWTERSNALRMVGRREEAIAVAEAVLADLAKSGSPATPDLRRNLGILYR
jgi:hypothetical protein